MSSGQKDPKASIMNFHAQSYTSEEINLIADFFQNNHNQLTYETQKLLTQIGATGLGLFYSTRQMPEQSM